MRYNILMRIVLGLFAISPLLVIGLVVVVLITGPTSTIPFGRIVIASTLVTILLYGGTVAYFLYLVQANPALESSDKARWTFMLLMFFPFGAVSFWYTFVWMGARNAR